MALQVFATFEGHFPADAEFEHPEGCHLARALERSCRDAGFMDTAFDNWRDGGWYVSAAEGPSVMWICFARYASGQPWQLLVERRGPSGVIARILGKPPVTTLAVRRLASVVEAVLLSQPSVSALRWSLGRDPRKSGVASLAELPWPHSESA